MNALVFETTKFFIDFLRFVAEEKRKARQPHLICEYQACIMLFFIQKLKAALLKCIFIYVKRCKLGSAKLNSSALEMI